MAAPPRGLSGKGKEATPVASSASVAAPVCPVSYSPVYASAEPIVRQSAWTTWDGQSALPVSLNASQSLCTTSSSPSSRPQSFSCTSPFQSLSASCSGCRLYTFPDTESAPQQPSTCFCADYALHLYLALCLGSAAAAGSAAAVATDAADATPTPAPVTLSTA